MVADTGEVTPVEGQPVYVRPPGRPSLLSPEVERLFLACIRNGNYRTVAAIFCGLKPDTVEHWIMRGRGQLPDRAATEPYRRFVRLVEQAEAEAEVLVVGNLVERAKHDHNAALAWLRANPERRKRWPLPREMGEEDDDGSGPLPALPPGPAMPSPVVHQTTNVLFLTPDQVPDFVRNELDRARAARAEAHDLTNGAGIQPEQIVSGTRIPRLSGLRTEPSADEDDGDDLSG